MSYILPDNSYGKDMKEVHKPIILYSANPVKYLVKVASLLLFKLWFRSRGQYIFILAHMRSGSTLLTNILCGNNSILGFGEHHVTYESADDLNYMAFRNCWFYKKPAKKGTYFLDKVVNNHNKVSSDIFSRSDCFFIFLLRGPEETLSSAAKLFPDVEVTDLAENYMGRLSALETYSNLISNESNKITLTYDELVCDTASVFERLESFLHLASPLESNYKVEDHMGNLGLGDSSENIKRGKILRTKKELIKIPENILNSTKEKYHDVKKALFQTQVLTRQLIKACSKSITH